MAPSPDIERLPDPEKDSPVKTQRKTTSIFEAKMFGPGPKEKPPMVLALNRENPYVTSDAQRERIREFIDRKARERKEGIPRLLSARPDLVKKKPVDNTGHLGDPEEEEEEKTKRRRRRRWPVGEEGGADISVGNGEAMDGVLVHDDLNEPTMGEKLSSLNLVGNSKDKIPEDQEPSRTMPPSADSVDVLLKQALNADDRVLLLNCLYTQDEKVIANSVSLLSPSNVFKLLDSLLSVIQSRGAVLACALPWLRSLLLQHSSSIMSQESSLVALNSLYQLIDSRVSTFQSALQLSSFMDLIYVGIADDVEDENSRVMPLIYEDKDESDEEESEDAMDTDNDDEEIEGFGGVSYVDGSDDDMSD